MVGLDRSGPPRTEVDVLVDERTFGRRHEPLPHLLAVVDVDPSLVEGELEALGATAESRLRGALRESSCELAARVAGTLEGALAHDEPALAFVHAWLGDVTAKNRRRAAAERAILSLREARIFQTVQGTLASISECTARRRAVRVSAPIDGWLGPAEGEGEDTLDQPVLVRPSGESALGDVIAALAPGLVRDVSADVRRLQAKRRVLWGLVARPRLGSIRDPRFRWTLEELANVAGPSERGAFETLGIGEVALTGESRTRLEFFEAGVRVSRLEWELRPAVEIACEPAVSTSQLAELERATRTVMARAIRHLVEVTPEDTIPAWVRAGLRGSALLGGHGHLEQLATLPMFETTGGRWVSFHDLQAQVARYEKLWVSGDPLQSLEPLDPERIAVRLPRGEGAQLGMVLPVADADEELRLDALARRNRERPAVAEIGPDDAQRSLALGEASFSADGARGVVLALHPAHASARALHASRERRPLGAIEDPSSWPALSWVEAPGFTPDRTWSAPVRDGVVEAVAQSVRDACERALSASFAAPASALASVRVDRVFSTQALSGRAAQVRGVLWLEPGVDPAVEIVDAQGTVERALTTSRGALRDAPLPLAGRLAVVGVAGTGAVSVLQSVGAHAYERMLAEIARRVSEGTQRPPELLDLELAELVRGAALGFVQEGHPGASIPLSFLGSKPATLLGVARALVDRDSALLVPPDRRADARALEWKGPIVIDDGSLAATRAIVAFGERAIRFEDALADRVRSSPEPGPAPQPQSAQLPAAGALVADAPSAPKRRKKAKREDAAQSTAAPPTAAQPTAAQRSSSHPLAASAETLVRRTSAARGRAPRIVVDPLAESPLAAPRPDGSVELAGAHPLVARAHEHPEALAILSAHALGVAARDSDDAHLAEGHAILALLSER